MNAVVNAGANMVPMLRYGQLQFQSGCSVMWLIFRRLGVVIAALLSVGVTK
jgi:hypothetical protein